MRLRNLNPQSILLFASHNDVQKISKNLEKTCQFLTVLYFVNVLVWKAFYFIWWMKNIPLVGEIIEAKKGQVCDMQILVQTNIMHC